MTPARPSGRLVWAACVASIVALILAQQFAQITGPSLLGRAVSNALHVPLFATITALLGVIMPRAPVRHVVGISVLLAAASELAQIPTGRSASGVDLLRDLAGILPVAAGLWWQRSGRPHLLAFWLGVGMLLLAATAWMPAQIAAAYVTRDQAFPVLFDPAMPWPRPLWSSNSPATVVMAPDAAGFSGSEVLEVTWASKPRYPGLTLHEVVPDWKGFDALLVALQVDGDAPLPLTVGLQYRGLTGTLASASRQARPGYQVLQFPLLDLQAAESSEVATVILHTNRAAAGRRVLIGRICLTRDD